MNGQEQQQELQAASRLRSGASHGTLVSLANEIFFQALSASKRFPKCRFGYNQASIMTKTNSIVLVAFWSLNKNYEVVSRVTFSEAHFQQPKLTVAMIWMDREGAKYRVFLADLIDEVFSPQGSGSGWILPDLSLQRPRMSGWLKDNFYCNKCEFLSWQKQWCSDIFVMGCLHHLG